MSKNQISICVQYSEQGVHCSHSYYFQYDGFSLSQTPRDHNFQVEITVV